MYLQKLIAHCLMHNILSYIINVASTFKKIPVVSLLDTLHFIHSLCEADRAQFDMVKMHNQRDRNGAKGFYSTGNKT